MPKVPSGARNKKLYGGEKVNVKKHTSVIISPAREMSVKSGKRRQGCGQCRKRRQGCR